MPLSGKHPGGFSGDTGKCRGSSARAERIMPCTSLLGCFRLFAMGFVLGGGGAAVTVTSYCGSKVRLRFSHNSRL